ncbi:MAG: aminomethyl-transferring glycine dehydrogenase subunit GcvPA [Pseudomonadota bacterium]
MPFIPHTEKDVADMLAAIGVKNIDELFDEIPSELRAKPLDDVPAALSEMEIRRQMFECAQTDGLPRNFIGAGAYEHHIPAAVWQITTRGEFYSAYTPYQAEASQGTLQLIYEYQSMMCSLTGMDVSNASLYDGASALAEAALMAIRANRKSKSKKLLIAGAVHPYYLEVAQNITKGQGLGYDSVPFIRDSGAVDSGALPQFDGHDYAALVISQPNFFGVLEQADQLTDWAHAQGMLVIAVVNPTSLSLLKPPGEWGTKGADIVCGEGQPLGVPVSSGGPYFGFMTTRQHLVRQMPGRIVGRTVDTDGKPGFTLTLQAREQHIRRSRATSNICTNQGLMVTAATIYMSILGAEGLRRVAATSHANLVNLLDKVTRLDGVTQAFAGAHYHEAVLTLDRPVGPVLSAMAERGFVAGFGLEQHFPELGNAILVCCTETKSEQDLQDFVDALQSVLQQT